MAYCPKCGINNEENAESCYYCGANLKESNEVENTQYTEKSSKGNDSTSMLDFPAIGKGLLIGLPIGLLTVGFIGMLFGGIITGYFTSNNRWKHVAVNGWIVGFINVIIWSVVSLLFPYPILIKSFTDVVNITGSAGLTLALIILLILMAVIGLIGSIGGIIGSKISKRRDN